LAMSNDKYSSNIVGDSYVGFTREKNSTN
jgi:hypothetical protein